MFRFTKKPSSESNSQYLAKFTSLVQCRHRRRTDVVSAMAYDLCGVCVVYCVHNTHATQVILCSHSTENVCTTSISTLNQARNFS